MTCEWCSTSCSIESERRSKRRKPNLSKSFSSPKEFPAPSVLRIRPGRPRKNNGLDITKHDHMNNRRKILKQTVHDSTTFPLYPVQQGKIWRKRCTFLVAAGRYLLTRLIYSLYRPRLLPRPLLHYGEVVTHVCKSNHKAGRQSWNFWVGCNPHCLQLSLSALVSTLVTQAGLSVLSWGRTTLMCKMSIVR